MYRQSFRAWLVEKVLGTKYARMAILDEQIDKVAERVGVQPDVLLEARALARIRDAERGVMGAPRFTSELQARHRRLYEYHLPMPKVIHDEWKEECAFRVVESSTLLRSLIHHYLSTSYEPAETVRGWRRDGVRLLVPKAVEHENLERATVTQGAKRALHIRAQRRGATSIAVVRALVLETLAGGFRGLPLVETKRMYDDEKRYYLGGELGPLTGPRVSR